jgi:amino acid permease
VVVSPASYASFAGIIGCVFYALAAGIPVMIIAFFGQSVSERYPSCQSVGDFIHLRFGPTARLLVSMLTLFNMCIAMLAEYTTIGTLFQVPSSCHMYSCLGNVERGRRTTARDSSLSRSESFSLLERLSSLVPVDQSIP